MANEIPPLSPAQRVGLGHVAYGGPMPMIGPRQFIQAWPEEQLANSQATQQWKNDFSKNDAVMHLIEALRNGR